MLRRTDHCEHTIQQHQMPAKSSERLTLASFVVTESEINKITQDVQDLARYQRLNYTAFLKIIKKHDKHTGYTLRTRLMSWLNNQPFHKESFAPLVSRLSTLYNIVRTGNAPAASKARSIDSSEEEEEELEQHPGYVPKKSAYWVHSDSIMDLKMLILKYLPLVVYEPTPALSSSHRSTSSQMSTCLASESPVSTVYLDNEDFELYTAQVEHRDTAETVRLRWYGSESKHIWVEHQQKTTVAASPPPSGPPSPANKLVTTKHRFQLKAKYVPNLVQGTAELGKSVQQMRLSGQKSAQEMEQFEQSTCNVQTRVQQRRLQPVVQTFFNRTAFQVPGDARVRITIDTDVVMVRERRIETSDIYKRPWNPTDLKTDNYPFSHVRAQDIVRFPFAVMQIRTLTEPDEETPAWVDYIAQSPLVQLVPNFSKDLHAIATLYESRVSLLPFWVRRFLSLLASRLSFVLDLVKASNFLTALIFFLYFFNFIAFRHGSRPLEIHTHGPQPGFQLQLGIIRILWIFQRHSELEPIHNSNHHVRLRPEPPHQDALQDPDVLTAACPPKHPRP